MKPRPLHLPGTRSIAQSAFWSAGVQPGTLGMLGNITPTELRSQLWLHLLGEGVADSSPGGGPVLRQGDREGMEGTRGIRSNTTPIVGKS